MTTGKLIVDDRRLDRRAVLGGAAPGVCRPAKEGSASMRAFAPLRIAALTVVALCALLALLAVPAASRAAPPKEKFEVVHVDETFVDTFLTAQCGFTVLVHWEGTFVFSVEPVALDRVRMTATFIGPNGASLTNPDVGVNKLLSVVEDAAGNTVVTVQFSGLLFYRIAVPGEGVVLANAGREVVRFTFDGAGNFVGEVIEDVGLSRTPDEAELAALCAYLAQ